MHEVDSELRCYVNILPTELASQCHLVLISVLFVPHKGFDFVAPPSRLVKDEFVHQCVQVEGNGETPSPMVPPGERSHNHDNFHIPPLTPVLTPGMDHPGGKVHVLH